MQVSNTVNSYVTQVSENTKAVPTQEQQDARREHIVALAGNSSKQAQIDVYVQSTKNANEQYNDLNSTANTTENYTDFASDVRRADNYATYLNNGGNPSELIDRPSTQPIQQPIQNPEEISDSGREALAGVAENRSTQSQIDAYKVGAQQSNTTESTLKDTQEYVNNYNDFAQQARRSENINTYIDNSKLFA